jgi:flagellar basal-body rod protein FlgG
MSEILSIALHSMHQDMSRLDQIAINMANVSTPGYKRQVTAAVAFGDVVQDLGAVTPDVAGARSLQARPAENGMALLTDLHGGTLRSTGAALDLAIDGNGFFEIATANGPAYTRQGSFKVDARGRLTTLDGNPVMGKSGEIFLTSGAPSIDSQGNITEEALAGGANGKTKASVGQLKVIKFDDEKSLAPSGNGLYTGTGATTQLSDLDVKIRQGYLENSNVNSLQEMMRLMQTMRHFESVQKTAQGYDEMIGDAIKKLGDA